MQAFIAGRLPVDEQRAFEDRLAREPALVDELEQSLRMREGLRRLRSRKDLQIAPARRMPARVWVPALAMAASAILGLFLWMSRGVSPAPVLLSSLEADAVGAAASTVTAQFTFVSMRGSAIPDLSLPASGMVELRAAAADDAAQYRVTLQRLQSGDVAQPVGTVAGVAVGPDGYVHVYADAHRLAVGHYELTLQADPSGTAAGDVFEFNLRADAQ